MLPDKFIAREKETLSGDDFANFIESLETTPPVSIRLNPLKGYTYPDFESRVAWCEHGLYLHNRPQFTADPVFHGGAYYVQEASSMFSGWLAERVVADMSEPRILDLCAAPGGKTTHLATVAHKVGGVVVANEPIRSRARILAENVQKWGSGNVAVTSNDPADFAPFHEFFDLVVVDAPCSGEGMFRKDHDAREEWSEANVDLCAARQRRILSDIWGSLCDAGVLIYSTCTFNRKENEENAAWILNELGGELITFDDLPQGVLSTDAGFRFYPHRIKGEGFYAVAIRKSGYHGRMDMQQLRRGANSKTMQRLTKQEQQIATGWVNSDLASFGIGGGEVYAFPDSLYAIIEPLRSHLNLLYSGVQMGTFMRDELKPSHALALSHALNRTAVTISQVDLPTALEYLRKGNPCVKAFENGLSLVEYNGVALGWIKRISTRCNNLYPQQWRILKL